MVQTKRQNKWLWSISVLVALCTMLLSSSVLAGGGMNGHAHADAMIQD